MSNLRKLLQISNISLSTERHFMKFSCSNIDKIGIKAWISLCISKQIPYPLKVATSIRSITSYLDRKMPKYDILKHPYRQNDSKFDMTPFKSHHTDLYRIIYPGSDRDKKYTRRLRMHYQNLATLWNSENPDKYLIFDYFRAIEYRTKIPQDHYNIMHAHIVINKHEMHHLRVRESYSDGPSIDVLYDKPRNLPYGIICKFSHSVDISNRKLPEKYRFDVAINAAIIYLRQIQTYLCQFLYHEMLVNIIVYDMLSLHTDIDEDWITLCACQGYRSELKYVCMVEKNMRLWHNYCNSLHKMMISDVFMFIKEEHVAYRCDSDDNKSEDSSTWSGGFSDRNYASSYDDTSSSSD